jgi:hypothetical protein
VYVLYYSISLDCISLYINLQMQDSMATAKRGGVQEQAEISCLAFKKTGLHT